MKKDPNRAQLIGKAGEYAVMAELLLRGHVPYQPPIDNGADIVLRNGISIQVKTSHLSHTEKPHSSYKFGYYRFDLYQHARLTKNLGPRDFTKVCDYIVLWCIDEDRFFVLPATRDKRMVLIPPKTQDRCAVIDVARAKEMYASGMNMNAIAKEMGVSWPTVKDHIKGNRKGNRFETLSRQILQYENRWDLLDVNQTVETLIQGEPGEVRQEKV